MEQCLIFIKHNFRFLWRIIEQMNGLLFSCFYRKKLEKVLPGVFKEFSRPQFTFRKLELYDTQNLYSIIHNQEDTDLRYFHPHEFDINSIKKKNKKKSFLMMGVMNKEEIVGYFFLRFFTNRTCFVGRIIDKSYRGKGIGLTMNNIMYETAWRMGFRCLSTISRDNKDVMRAHARNPSMIVIKGLRHNYLLVEFVRESRRKGFGKREGEKKMDQLYNA